MNVMFPCLKKKIIIEKLILLLFIIIVVVIIILLPSLYCSIDLPIPCFASVC